MYSKEAWRGGRNVRARLQRDSQCQSRGRTGSLKKTSRQPASHPSSPRHAPRAFANASEKNGTITRVILSASLLE